MRRAIDSVTPAQMSFKGTLSLTNEITSDSAKTEHCFEIWQGLSDCKASSDNSVKDNPRTRAITSKKEGEENFVGDSEIIALGGASNETKDRPLG